VITFKNRLDQFVPFSSAQKSAVLIKLESLHKICSIEWADTEGDVKAMRLGKSSMVIIGTFVLLLLIVLILVGIGHSKSSPEHLLQSYKETIKNNDASAFKQLLVSDDKDVEITTSSSQALLHYLRMHKETYHEITDSLTKAAQIKKLDSDSVLSITQHGRRYLIFKNYKLKLQSQPITVTGLRKGEQLALNANQQGISHKGNNYGRILPGTYVLQKQLTNDLGIFIKKEKIAVWDQPITIDVNSAAWMAHDASVQKAVIERINQFNSEVSIWETSEYVPTKLPSATEQFKKTQSAMRMTQFAKLKGQLDELQSAYLGMVVDPDSLTLTHYGDQWNASVDTVVSYKYGYKLKKEKQMKDDSYQRGINFRLVYDKNQRRWLINGISDNYITLQTASLWTHKKELSVPDPVVHTWPADKQPNL
jgi:hypothetical protein